PPIKRTLRTLFPPTVLPSSVTSDMSPLRKKLLTYRRSNEHQEMINQILIDRALKVYHRTMEETHCRDPAPPIPGLSSIVRKYFFNILSITCFTNYLFMKERVESNPMLPIPQQWLMSVLALVPQSLMEGRDRELLTGELLGEIVREYEMSIRRCMLRRVLIKPDIEGLEEEEEAPLPLLPLGLDFSSSWRNSFIKAKRQILSTLHIVHPTMQTLLGLGCAAFSSFLIVDFSSSRLKGPVDCKSFKADASLSCSKAEEEILNTWYQNVIRLFTQNEAFNGVKLDQVDSFYNCVAVLMSNQLKELLGRTTEAFVKLFDPEDIYRLPLFNMDLTLEENNIEFYPSFQDLEESILFVVDCIGETLQNIQSIRSWLTGVTETVDSELPNHIMVWATSTLKKSIRDNLEGPKEHFENYVEMYGWLVDGTAEAQIKTFEAEQHSFDEYT
ncbi:DYH12 protein, partial [Calyptomena viridis]|nr:DYH12 protein [Calyptomena viridis]